MSPEKSSSTNRVLLPILLWLTFLGTLVANALASLLPINGITTGELSDSYPNLFVPVGLTFAIWGLIYSLLLAYTIVATVRAVRSGAALPANQSRMAWLFVATGVVNTAWILLWHYEMPFFSLIAMLALLVLLLGIYRSFPAEGSFVNELFVRTPFRVYLGWITVATIANGTAVLVDAGWNGFGLSEPFWTLLVLVVAVVMAGLFLLLHRDVPYSLVVAWALFGIYLKHNGNGFFAGEYPAILWTAAIGAILVLLGALAALPAWLRRFRKTS